MSHLCSESSYLVQNKKSNTLQWPRRPHMICPLMFLPLPSCPLSLYFLHSCPYSPFPSRPDFMAVSLPSPRPLLPLRVFAFVAPLAWMLSSPSCLRDFPPPFLQQIHQRPSLSIPGKIATPISHAVNISFLLTSLSLSP